MDLSPDKVQPCKKLAEEIVSFNTSVEYNGTDAVIQFYSKLFKIPAFEKTEKLQAGAM